MHLHRNAALALAGRRRLIALMEGGHMLRAAAPSGSGTGQGPGAPHLTASISPPGPGSAPITDASVPPPLARRGRRGRRPLR